MIKQKCEVLDADIWLRKQRLGEPKGGIYLHRNRKNNLSLLYDNFKFAKF